MTYSLSKYLVIVLVLAWPLLVLEEVEGVVVVLVLVEVEGVVLVLEEVEGVVLL